MTKQYSKSPNRWRVSGSHAGLPKWATLAIALVVGSRLSWSTYAVDITIFDQVTKYRASPTTREWWGDGNLLAGTQHADPRGIAEDNETEPGTAVGQQWDLEAFRIDGTTLSLIGGFDFLNGHAGFASGDIFIDVDGDAAWGEKRGTGGTAVLGNSLFKYDYVIDLQQTIDANLDSVGSAIGPQYTVYRLDEESDQVVSVTYTTTARSNPWIYHSGGDAVAGYTERDIVAGYYTGGEYAGWGGNNTHHLLQFDLGFLGSTIPDGTLFKFTMECGNDSLVGRYARVPDTGTTLLLLGGGLIVLVSGLVGRGHRP